ncbi:MAG: hypothetical protein EOL87_13880 [Spartobacteria bacterium]|nr:hypothetical protein [Spartobacteria bacterium]
MTARFCIKNSRFKKFQSLELFENRTGKSSNHWNFSKNDLKKSSNHWNFFKTPWNAGTRGIPRGTALFRDDNDAGCGGTFRREPPPYPSLSPCHKAVPPRGYTRCHRTPVNFSDETFFIMQPWSNQV